MKWVYVQHILVWCLLGGDADNLELKKKNFGYSLSFKYKGDMSLILIHFKMNTLIKSSNMSCWAYL